MGRMARDVRKRTVRKIRAARLSTAERTFLLQAAKYEGSPQHKRNPGDFGLTPPSSPRPDKTLCDEAGIYSSRRADELLRVAIERGVVSEAFTDGFPKQLWAYDGVNVFEAMLGGSTRGSYHGYPIRKTDPFFEELLEAWNVT
jgi:hypothetical protein